MQNYLIMTKHQEPWLRYATPIVRQLAFCISSPNILSQVPSELPLKYPFELHEDLIWQQHYLNYEKRLMELDRDPTPLLAFLNKLKSTRLGLRFEYLFWFWLQDQAYHHYQLIGHSIQMIKGSQTLGELDFLLLNTHTQEIEHWEVALKYYLAEYDLGLHHWYGLNRSDTLFKKLNHFTQQQFKFDFVNNQLINRRFAVIKGQLYIPNNVKVIIPDWVNSSRNIGSWGTEILPDYYRLQRQEWLCPNQHQSSQNAVWWTNGLYHQTSSNSFYMFRNHNQFYLKC